jgi:hypothetical protein
MGPGVRPGTVLHAVPGSLEVRVLLHPAPARHVADLGCHAGACDPRLAGWWVVGGRLWGEEAVLVCTAGFVGFVQCGLVAHSMLAVKQQCSVSSSPCTTSPKLLHVGRCSSTLACSLCIALTKGNKGGDLF